MRFQKVSVDVWKVIVTSGSCLFLAFIAWVFLKLVYACFWLPDYLKKQEEEKMQGRLGELEQAGQSEEVEEKDEETKKNK